MGSAKNPFGSLHPTLFHQETLTLLRLSAIAGIDVRILYPGKSDSIISDQASQSYFTPLLKAGASIYSYKDGFMHAKIVLVDDTIATIGTANMDVRSFELNYEIISVLYESKQFTTLNVILKKILNIQLKLNGTLSKKKYKNAYWSLS